MEGLNGYDNQGMQNEKHVIFINETKVDKVIEERENPNLQTKINRFLGINEEINEDKTKHIWNNYKFNEENGVLIIETFYVGLSIVLMTTQR
jgi:hypothetical protein